MSNGVRRYRVVVVSVVFVAACSTGGRTPATTEEGYLLPPGVEELTTIAPPLVTEFDGRSECDRTAPDVDVLRLQSLVAAYNARDARGLTAVLGTGVFDFAAVPHLGVREVDDPLAWAQAGWAVDDRLRLVEVRTYSGSGADGRMERSNDLLAGVGIEWLAFGFKTQGRGCAITRFVGYAPDSDACDWYVAFSDEIRTVDPVLWQQRVSDGGCTV